MKRLLMVAVLGIFVLGCEDPIPKCMEVLMVTPPSNPNYAENKAYWERTCSESKSCASALLKGFRGCRSQGLSSDLANSCASLWASSNGYCK